MKTMKTMNIKEYSELLKEISEYHLFGYIDEEIISEKKKFFPKYETRFIKYIDSIFDTREGHSGIWSVTFRNGDLNKHINENTESVYTTLYEHCLSWLNGEIE